MSKAVLPAREPPEKSFTLWVALLGALLPGLYLLLTSTTTLITGIWPYDAKRILQFSLLFVLFSLPLLNRELRAEFEVVLGGVPRWVGWPLAGVFAWGVVSALVNATAPMHLANSLSEIALLGSLVLGAFVIAASRRLGGVAFDRVAVGLIALTGLAVGIQELLGVAAAHASGVEFNFSVSLLHFSWPRFYNQVQSWTIPVVGALPILFSRYSLAKVLTVIVLALNWYIILMTGARGSFIALSAAMMLVVVFLPATRKPLLQWQAAGILVGALLFAAVLYTFQAESSTSPEIDSRDSQTEVWQSSNTQGFYGNEGEGTSSFLGQSVGRPLLDPMGRLGMWQVTLRDARDHPFFGIGPMNYVCTSPAHIGHPHNFVLQVAAEWGVPVAVTICLLFTGIVVRAGNSIRMERLRSINETLLASLLLAGVVAASFHSLVSGVLVMPASQVAGILVCGTLLGFREYNTPATAFPRAIGISLAGIVLSAGLMALGQQELRTMAERSPLMKPGEDLRPRIWQDAKVCRLYVPQNEVSN